MLAERHLLNNPLFRSPEFSRLWMAFAVSLALHLMIFGTYQFGQAVGLWQHLRWNPMGKIIEELQEAKIEAQRSTGQPPLLFVDVNPSVSTDKAPDSDTPYYSDKNSIASNPLTEETTDMVLFDGTETRLVRTDDVPPSKVQPLVPAAEPPVPDSDKPSQDEVKSSTLMEGDLVLAKLDEQAEPAEEQKPAEEPRPRTLKEAMSRLSPAEMERLAGRKMKQAGGVRRLSMQSSLDVKASPFGDYDRTVILAIQTRWFDLLDMRGFGFEKSGRVVVEFRLHYDGRISRMNVSENTVDEMLSLLCQRAISDPAPYAEWSNEMRRTIGANYRDVRFTFYYD